jgi:CHASE2 domain-containing sensor protein
MPRQASQSFLFVVEIDTAPLFMAFMTSLFLVILTDQLRDVGNRLPAAVGGASATMVFAALAAVIGAARARADMLIPTMVLMVASLLLLRGHIERREGEVRA